MGLFDLFPLKLFAAYTTSGLLTLTGVEHGFAFLGEPTIIVGNIYGQITDLCTGNIELIVLFAAILSTFDRSVRNRLWGCVFAAIAVLALNPLRIFTVLYIGNSVGWATADMAHEVLFRALLFIAIVGYYFVWYVKSHDIMDFVRTLKSK
ncbi:MAG: exosortase/archaeosortase family protein [DPANN group archaeon]|nr:exosortase/archaeosortase family protein [DPANN group archaeon]